MKKSFLRSCAVSIALVLGAASMPTIAAPSPAFAGPVVSFATRSVAHAQPAWLLQVPTLKAFDEAPTGGNACDPITPQNWCECGGCSGSGP